MSVSVGTGTAGVTGSGDVVGGATIVSGMPITSADAAWAACFAGRREALRAGLRLLAVPRIERTCADAERFLDVVCLLMRRFAVFFFAVALAGFRLPAILDLLLIFFAIRA